MSIAAIDAIVDPDRLREGARHLRATGDVLARRAALGRDPSPDDLRFRVRQLAAGKRRAAFIEEVYGSDEARQRRVREVLGRAGEISEAP